MSKTFVEKTRLINAIIEHNCVSQMVVKFNQFFKHMVFVLYFVAAPAIEMLDKNAMIIFRWSCIYFCCCTIFERKYYGIS